MFTGIIETTGRVISVQEEGGNKVFRFTAELDEPIKIDQSIAHNGVCLTVTAINKNSEKGHKEYEVVAVDETLRKTNLGQLKTGDLINIERCLVAGQRLDGHFVQGHVDTTGEVIAVSDADGSTVFEFSFPNEYSNLLVDKGSICVNGVSLTVIHAGPSSFTVTIIPYTLEHTNFQQLKKGDKVNLEFDILGKYLVKMYAER